MKKRKRPIIINAGIVLLLFLIDFLFNSKESTKPLPRFAFSGLFILVLAFVNLLIGMIRNRGRNGDGQYYLLFAGVLLLIGFSVCSYS